MNKLQLFTSVILVGFALLLSYNIGVERTTTRLQAETAERYIHLFGEPATDSEICDFQKIVFNDFTECVQL